MKEIIPSIYGDGYRLACGDYYIGDPTLFLNEDDQDELITAIESIEVDETCLIEFESGSFVIAMHTMSEEDMFFDEDGNEYPSEEQVMCIVPVNDKYDFVMLEQEGTGVIHRFSHDVLVENMAGVLIFGDVVINTRVQDF